MRYVSIGSAMIDDIVLPDGVTHMGVLGGGGPHAAAGMRFALSLDATRGVSTIGLVSLVGEGFPDAAMAALSNCFDTTGCIRKPLPHPRAWQLFEEDGRRTEVFRAGDPAVLINIPEPQDLPSAYRPAIGIHLLREGEPARAWITYLRQVAPRATILWEPAQRYMRPENRDAFPALLSLPDVVSPNLAEAAAIYDDASADPEHMLNRLLTDGARVVALRMGEQGSLVGSADRPAIHVPALPVEQVVDQTGAGNMYCGAFLAGLCETGSLEQAGLFGASAGKAALGQWGIWGD
jgi:sugar/nucleoside kinase (ribokinase family)